jgi:hypothetical protein
VEPTTAARLSNSRVDARRMEREGMRKGPLRERALETLYYSGSAGTGSNGSGDRRGRGMSGQRVATGVIVGSGVSFGTGVGKNPPGPPGPGVGVAGGSPGPPGPGTGVSVNSGVAVGSGG